MLAKTKRVDIRAISNPALERLVQAFEDHQLFLVGGMVRDLLLARKSTDYDLTTDATPKTMLEIAKKYQLTTRKSGLKFGCIVFIIDDYHFEVTTFRQENIYLNHRYPKEIKFITSIKDDLLRRDFTINALAIDLKHENQLVDYVNGYKDLNERVIRTIIAPDISFQTDYLRILRALRFAYTLNFTFDGETANAIKTYQAKILDIPKIKISQEIEKIILAKSKTSLLTLESLFVLIFPKLRQVDLKQNLLKMNLCKDYVLDDKNFLLLQLRYLFNGLVWLDIQKYLISYQFSKIISKQLKILFKKQFRYSELITIAKQADKGLINIFQLLYDIDLKIYDDFHLAYPDTALKQWPEVADMSYQELIEIVLKEIFQGQLKNNFEDIHNFIKNIYH